MTESVVDPNATPAAPVVADPTGGTPAQAPSTLDPGTPPATPAPTDWAPDWREKMAGGDAKELTRLQRFTSPVDVYKANRALETKLSQGQFKTPLPENPTPEQVAIYRKENGIPETAQGYDVSDVGFEINDVTKPRIDYITKAMHDMNADPKIVKGILKSYADLVIQEDRARAAQDEVIRAKTDAEIRQEWGAQYPEISNTLGSFLDKFPELKELMSDGSRLKDGTQIKDSAVVKKALARLALEFDPLHTIVGGGNGDKLESVQSEMATIQAKMGTDKYTEADRARMIELNTIMEKVKTKAA